jgi:hypothetical protein
VACPLLITAFKIWTPSLILTGRIGINWSGSDPPSHGTGTTCLHENNASCISLHALHYPAADVHVAGLNHAKL